MDFGALLQEHNRRSKDEDFPSRIQKELRKRSRSDFQSEEKNLENNSRHKRKHQFHTNREYRQDNFPPSSQNRVRFDGYNSQRYRNEQYGINHRLGRPWKGKEGCAKYLVILPAGDKSMHDDEEKPWYSKVHAKASFQKSEEEKPPNDTTTYRTDKFDLCVIHYGEDKDIASKYEKQCKYFFRKQGPKWQLIRTVLKQGFWRNYEYVWFPDDDLKISMKDIGKMFDIASEYRISMGQPSLYNINVQKQYARLLVHRPKLVLHFTNFVEIMCPFFRFDALELVAETIDDDGVKSGWGLDILWPTMLNFENIAVIDKTPLTHTRPQNAFNLQSSFYTKYKIDPQRECFDLMAKYRISDFRKIIFREVKQVEE